ncbi:twin-arginine translocation pathway signal [Bradyrhizobium sp.]|uniref:twin-arginine translocation pathway signal n=1 Tax=Bradyrhizobium sp. TaxID=376 RepID=UPI003C76CFF8
MSVRASHLPLIPRAAGWLALLALGLGVSGCAEMSDGMTSAFADPAKYDLYDCKQLEAERQRLASRGAELQGLMAKAETGAAGSVVSVLAYQNDYVTVRGQTRLAEQAWRRNKCQESKLESKQEAKPAVAAAPPAGIKGARPGSRPTGGVH